VAALGGATTAAEARVPQVLLQTVEIVLKEALVSCLAALPECKARVAEAASLLEAGEATCERTRLALEAAFEAAIDKEAEFSRQLAAVQEVADKDMKAYKELEAELGPTVWKHAVLQRGLALAEKAVVAFTELESGVSGDERSAAVEAVLKSLDEMGDEAMRLAVASALQRLPSEQSQFDAAILETVKSEIAGAVARYGESLAACAESAEAAKAELLGVWAIADLTRDAVKEVEGTRPHVDATEQPESLEHRRAEAAAQELRQGYEQCLALQRSAEAAVEAVRVALDALGRLAVPPALALPAAAVGEGMLSGGFKDALRASGLPVPTPLGLQTGNVIDAHMASEET